MAFSTPSPQVPLTLLSSSTSSSSSISIEGTPYEDPTLFNAYEIAMQEVLESFRVMQKKDNPQDLEAAKRFLFSPQRFVDLSPEPNAVEDFKKYLMLQGDKFVKDVDMNKNQNQLVMRALTYMGDYCAKRGISAPLHVAWDKVKEAGLIPRENSLSAYLYILSSLPSGVGADDDTMVITTYNPDVAGEVACYHDMIYKPTENTVSIRIKSLVEEGKAEEAENLLWNLESVATPTPLHVQSKKNKKANDNGMLRLRTCLPVLQSYCQEGDMFRGLQLYNKMRQVPSIHFEAETYVLILSSLARRGYFRTDSEPIHGVGEFGYASKCGASLFNVIAAEMADDILEISSDSAKEMRNAFVDGFSSSDSARNLYPVPYDCDLSSLSDLAEGDELVANRITIDSNSTICERTNATLRLILLEESQKKQVHDTLIEMADTQFDAYETKLQKKGNKPSKVSTEDNYAGKHLEGFADWLNDREGEPFTCIIDGANVAYYGIGCINYHQIKLMVTAIEKMGEKPLVIMPQKYAQKKFHLRQGYVQELPETQMAILQELEDAGMLYKVPHRCLDDYYWMLSSVSDQTLSRKGTNLDVSLDNEEKRFPGTRPILLTNDQMRDHKLELLEPRLFRRWVSSHIVNYHFPPFLNDASEEREITFSAADFTSREIQGNPSNANGDHDSGAMAWHFPVRDWDKNDRFCIRIPTI
eukprot:scaffold3465_cov267-Chaetoceros_neogracile.AAC.2